MIVDGKNTLQEIQDKFNKQFPFLRIEFFNADKSKGANFSKENLISDTSKALVDVGIIFKTSSVSLDVDKK